jgi:hypothetical protein
MEHTLDTYVLTEGKIVDYAELNKGFDCSLVEALYKGNALNEKDYENIDNCEYFDTYIDWKGITKSLANAIGYIKNYIKLRLRKDVSVEEVYDVITGIFVITSFNEVYPSVGISFEDQFRNEFANYAIFSKVAAAFG